MKRLHAFTAFVLLETFAVLLACMQSLHHVRTDEAKYLLNIPYPHPPLARFLLHLCAGLSFQEMLWRIVFATLVVQAVWGVAKLTADLRKNAQMAACLAWILSAALLFQAGNIMMAPLTALEGAVLLYLLLADDETRNPGWVGIFWLLSLFTAYQAVLFAPVAFALLWRSRTHPVLRLALFGLPLLLLALYTCTNPLVLGSMAIHTGDSAPPTQKLLELLTVWCIGGSIFVSTFGLYGMLRERMWSVFLSLLLVCAYVYLARFDYYAILFLPISVAGVVALLRRRHLHPSVLSVCAIIGSVMCIVLFPPSFEPSPARRVMHEIQDQAQPGPVLIHGNFGHEWQFETRREVLMFTPNLLTYASALVCLTDCENVDASFLKTGDNPTVYRRQ